MSERPLTVSALTRRIHDSLGGLGTVLVSGELSQAKVAQAGHLYATLTDGSASISLVMWRSTLARAGAVPREGTRVLVRGSLDVYAPRGSYSLVATRITPEGLGDLAAQFEALKARLREEGLFEEDRKRPLPLLPRAVGIATAEGSAALADILHGLRRRFPTMPLVHAPCAVQGPAAPASVVAALKRLGAHPEVDVIICGRGGGSLEDLWAFNEEVVVRAIDASPVPVISAVGHETDTTLADLVADLRAKTPTDAAELAVPVLADLREQIATQAADLDSAIDDRFEALRLQLDAMARHRALAGPEFRLRQRQRDLDELAARLERSCDQRLAEAQATVAESARSLTLLHPGRRVAALAERLAQRQRDLGRLVERAGRRGEERFRAAVGRLDALSPLAVIARGYAVLRTQDDAVLRSVSQVGLGSALRARLSDGWVEAEVTATRRERLAEAGDVYRDRE